MLLEMTPEEFYNYLTCGNIDELQHNLRAYVLEAKSPHVFVKSIEMLQDYYHGLNVDIMQAIKDGLIYIESDIKEVQKLKENYDFYIEEIRDGKYLINELR